MKINMIEFLSEKRKKQQFIYTYIIFMMNGMLALSIGSLLPFIRDARGLEYTFCGMLVSLHSVGNLLSSFFAGALAVKLGRKRSILLFNAFFAISYLLIIFGGNAVCLVLAFVMTGLARGATSNFSNATINNLAPGQAWIINGLHAMFSIGAFIFPILLMVLTAGYPDRWLLSCYFLLSIGILSWLLYWIMPVDELPQNQNIGEKESGNEETEHEETEREETEHKETSYKESSHQEIGDKSTEDTKTMGFFSEPLFLLCTATLFFYLCVEQGVIGWLVTYFKDTGLLNDSLSQIMASVQWIMILAGRLTTAYLSTKTDKSKLLRIMGVGLILFFIVLITGKTTPQIVIGIMGFGYSMAGIYPTTVSFAGNLIRKYPLSWSFMLTMASLGSIVMPSVIGRIAESVGIFYGMSSIVVVIIVDMALIIGLTAYVKRQRLEEEITR